MIVKILRDDSFAALLGYLLAVKKNVSLDRVEIHNLVSIETAAGEMKTVYDAAPKRYRIVGPAAHIIIGWKRDENPTVSAQKEAARRLRKRLGLDKNQSVIVVHDEAKGGQVPELEGRHFETHICVNRVRFDGTVANLPFEFVAGERACAEIAQEMGFTVVPGRFNGLKNSMPCQGLGNAIGSIAASGTPTIAAEIRENPERISALQAARSCGWDALLTEFHNQNIEIVEGPHRRRADLQPGLVMVDRGDERRRIKLSALDTADEKWSVFALKRELGPIPPNWQAKFAEEEVESHDLATQQLGENTAENAAPVTVMGHTDPSLAEEILSDPLRMTRLRAARASRQWELLIEVAQREGLGIEPGFNARRGTTTGLILVDLSAPERRIKASALDSPFEKWGQKALEKDLGPWPGLSSNAREGGSKSDVHEAPTSASVDRTGLNRTQRLFDRDAAYASFKATKASAISKNRDHRVRHKQRMDGLLKRQSSERDLHFVIRRARRDLINAVFGGLSTAGLLLNDLMDLLFQTRFENLKKTHLQQRRKLKLEQAQERAIVPLWPDFLREARDAHAKQLAEDDQRLEETLTQRIRARRDQIRLGVTAKDRLARAQAHADRWLKADCGALIRDSLRRDPHLSASVLQQRLKRVKKDAPQSRLRRLPMLVEEIREEIWIENTRRRRDRLCGSQEAIMRLTRMRSRRVDDLTETQGAPTHDQAKVPKQDDLDRRSNLSGPVQLRRARELEAVNDVRMQQMQPANQSVEDLKGEATFRKPDQSLDLDGPDREASLSSSSPAKAEVNSLWISIAGDYALWLRGRSDRVWSTELGARLAASVGLELAELMEVARRQCRTRYGHDRARETTWDQRATLYKEIVERISSSGFVALKPIRDEVKLAIKQAADITTSSRRHPRGSSILNEKS